MNTKVLSCVPSKMSLLLSLGVSVNFGKQSNSNSLALPDMSYHIEHLQLKSNQLHKFFKVVRWPLDFKTVHPCYLHVLAFPLQLKLMLSKGFPFPLLGIIHLSNQITQYRGICADETLRLVCYFSDLKKHPKGWSFSIKSQFSDDSDVVWASTSEYLYKNGLGSVPVDAATKNEGIDHSDGTVDYYLKSNLGRQYANVSGDYNPIHLHRIFAKMFGLKGHIVHGMWTKAFALSVIQKNGSADFSHPFQVTTDFKKPLFLPEKVAFSSTSLSAGEQHFSIISQSQIQSVKHLVGAIQPI